MDLLDDLLEKISSGETVSSPEKDKGTISESGKIDSDAASEHNSKNSGPVSTKKTQIMRESTNGQEKKKELDPDVMNLFADLEALGDQEQKVGEINPQKDQEEEQPKQIPPAAREFSQDMQDGEDLPVKDEVSPLALKEMSTIHTQVPEEIETGGKSQFPEGKLTQKPRLKTIPEPYTRDKVSYVTSFQDVLGESPFSFSKKRGIIRDARLIRGLGKIKQVTGLLVESIGPEVSLGEICMIYGRYGNPVVSEVVGFRDEVVILMPYGEMTGMAPGSRVVSMGQTLHVRVGEEILGRIIDPMGNPLDGKGPVNAPHVYPVDQEPPDPISRPSIREVLPLGIRAIDSCLTTGRGQRIGVFAGSGVGKSTMMGMIARNTEADINVIALVGERGREVREFVEQSLGEEGLKRSVVVVATSSEPAIVRLKASFVATAVAEYFRDQGNDVMLMMDSVTRFALAQREIGLAIGEPPTTRGYTPSVFAKLPRLFERAGTNEFGTITGFYTVLVEGGDMDEPVADAVRGLLDGHIVLDRALAERGHFPAISILQSTSRLILEIADETHLKAQAEMRELLALYEDMRELIDIGAYQHGANPRVDRAIQKNERIERFLRQGVHEKIEFGETMQGLREIVA